MLFRFKRGGVHPKENKITKDKEIEYFSPTSTIYYFPLNQHIGRPAKPIVKIRDKVKRGQLIAEASGPVSANIHSSITGSVKLVTSKYILIQKEEEIDPIKYQEIDINEMTPINEIALKAGIVGLGGATFPTHIKLNPPKKEAIDTIIINGAECEPYLTTDFRLMVERGKAIIEGAKLLQQYFPTHPKVYIGIEKNKPEAIEILSDLALKEIDIEVAPLRTRYPQGGEKQLIEAILGREVPSQKLPFDVGVLVQNVATVVALYEAYTEKKPLIERVVTVSGGRLVKDPKNVIIPLGTPIIDVLKAFDVDISKVAKVILGGPMMGKSISDLNKTAVTKGVNGILIFAEDEIYHPQPSYCISCARCIDACPIGLMPVFISKYSKLGRFEQTLKLNVFDCIECGSCSYVCPAKIDIVQNIRRAKIALKRQKQFTATSSAGPATATAK